jgi:hypothetical protein
VTAAAPQASQDRADYLRGICELLWPAPARAELADRPPAVPGDVSMIVLPGLRNPRLVVPAGRRPAAAAVRRYGEPASVRGTLAARVLSATLASGIGRRLIRGRVTVRVPPGAETIESRLSSVLGQSVVVSVHLGAARANRKPVLQLLTAAGETIGFAKVGVNPLTSDLVRGEQQALTRLHTAGLRQLLVPRVLGYDSWNGLEILVLGALPVWQKRLPLPPGLLDLAMAEVMRLAGTTESTLAASEYWSLLSGRLEAADDGQEQAALAAALGALEGVAGAATLGFGCWHGDWTPWNMACTAGGLLVWDWERFTCPAPVGYDALHYWLQAEVTGTRRDPAQAASECVRRAPVLLGPFGVPAPQARLTALLYLADLSVRYIADRQEQAGARLGAPRRWLLPALAAGISELSGSPARGDG